jgi:hypothetical protein
MAGGTIRSHRKKIHRESSRASVLDHSGGPAVLPSSATEKCCLTTPSLLSRATRPQSQSEPTFSDLFAKLILLWANWRPIRFVRMVFCC